MPKRSCLLFQIDDRSLLYLILLGRQIMRSSAEEICKGLRRNKIIKISVTQFRTSVNRAEEKGDDHKCHPGCICIPRPPKFASNPSSYSPELFSFLSEEEMLLKDPPDDTTMHRYLFDISSAERKEGREGDAPPTDRPTDPFPSQSTRCRKCNIILAHTRPARGISDR